MTTAEYDRDAYAGELAGARENRAVGSAVWFENDAVRVWDLELAPGERAPFHCHTQTYFWVCTAPGLGVQRFADGRMETVRYTVGQVGFNRPTDDEPLIHDLENTGETTLRFVTTELTAQ